MSVRPAALALCLVAGWHGAALAADDGADAATPAPVQPPLEPEPPQANSKDREVVVKVPAKPAPQAHTTVTRRDLEERQPRSAPDALRYEPGVYVQQTSAGQGSAFLRGRTGQQTVLLFDGIRMNNSLYRQGPNQYFFTIDVRTVERLEVTRGGASTRYGTDAIGGVLDAIPIEPRPGAARVRPSVTTRAASADGEIGGRAQLDARLADGLELVGGVGWRRVGLLTSGGAVHSPETGEPAPVPRFEDDGATQLGTGFHELAADARLVLRRGATRWTSAVYDYRQLDAPRTDQCPPPFAPRDECLRYDEQTRTLGYLRFDGDLGRAARESRFTLSFQRQHERRTRERPSSFLENGGRDDVMTVGAAAQLATARRRLAPWAVARLRWGADGHHDRVDSTAWTIFTDLDLVILSSRGQYLSGSRYTTGGAFAELEAAVRDDLIVRAGGRLGGAAAYAPADPESATQGIDRRWWAVVGHGGAEWRARPELTLLTGVDRSFRAPNLDDLTSRQATGPGYQFENPELAPETSLTLEVGARWAVRRVRVEAWLFRSSLEHAIVRAARDVDDCPATAPDCAGAWSRYQLVNLRGPAVIAGAEGSVSVRLPARLVARATLAWARGDGPNPQEPPSDPLLPYEETVPLSRIPPWNGAVELRWHAPRRVVAAAAARWALTQDRLAPSDRSDARIPTGGTPGFVVLDLRAGWQIDRRLRANLVFENVFDAAYRYHGSSINGPGRGLILSMEASL